MLSVSFLEQSVVTSLAHFEFLFWRKPVDFSFLISTTWPHTQSFAFWGREMPWLTGYFTGGVWASVYLMRAPVWLVERK